MNEDDEEHYDDGDDDEDVSTVPQSLVVTFLLELQGTEVTRVTKLMDLQMNTPPVLFHFLFIYVAWMLYLLLYCVVFL